MKAMTLFPVLLAVALGCGGSSDGADAGVTPDAAADGGGDIDAMGTPRSVTAPEVAGAMWVDLQENVFDLPVPDGLVVGDVAGFLVSCPVGPGNVDVSRDNDSSVEPTTIDVRFDLDDCAGSEGFSYNGFVDLTGTLADDGTFVAEYAADMFFQVTADTSDPCPIELSFTVDPSGAITASAGSLCGHDASEIELASPGAPTLAVENTD
jgi:hypothetical protein